MPCPSGACKKEAQLGWQAELGWNSIIMPRDEGYCLSKSFFYVRNGPDSTYTGRKRECTPSERDLSGR